MGVEWETENAEFCFVFGSHRMVYTKFGATFSEVPSGNLRPKQVKAFPGTHHHRYRSSSSSSSSWAFLNSESPWNMLVFPFLPALLVLAVARPWPSCCPCQKFRMNLKVVVRGQAGRLSLNRFAGNVGVGVGDFIGAMTVA